MTVQVGAELLVGFLLALVRTSAWLVACPPFNASSFNVRVKIGLAVGLSLFMAPQVGADQQLLTDGWAFMVAVAYQAFTGVAFGFMVLIVFQVIQAAGELIDLQAGFAAASLFDPFTNAVSTPIGRLYQLMATALLFVLDGHVALVRGFVTAFGQAPMAGPGLGELGEALIADIARFLVAALEIAAPVLAALFITDLVLGLLTRAAPQLNILVVGFALKIGLVLLVGGLVLVLLPGTVTTVLTRAIEGAVRVTLP